MMGNVKLRIDMLAKSPKFRHAPASAGAGSGKAGIQKYLKTMDSRLRGNDVRRRFRTIYETIKIAKHTDNLSTPDATFLRVE